MYWFLKVLLSLLEGGQRALWRVEVGERRRGRAARCLQGAASPGALLIYVGKYLLNSDIKTLNTFLEVGTNSITLKIVIFSFHFKKKHLGRY